MTAVFVASVGVPVGQVPVEDGAILYLRVGSQWVALDGASAALWRHALVPVRRDDVADTPSRSAQLDELVAAGVLAVVWDGGHPTCELLDLVPIGLGVGGGSNDVGGRTFAVDSWQGTELVRLDPVDHQIWVRLDGRTSVRRAVTAAARELGMDPADLRSRLPALITALLTSRAIALDAP